jgi:hypothetical protein
MLGHLKSINIKMTKSVDVALAGDVGGPRLERPEPPLNVGPPEINQY